MKAYERRAASAYPFFKVDSWDARSCVWRPNRATFASEAAGRAFAARRPGRYRLCRNDGSGLVEGEPFTTPAFGRR